MKKIFGYGIFLSLFVLPVITLAQQTIDPDSELQTFVGGIIAFINQVVVPLLVAIAFLVFIYGVVKYFFVASKEGDNKKEGQNLIMFGIIGFVLIVSIWGIVNIVADGLGLKEGGDTVDLPSATEV